MARLRVALVCDWLTTIGGAERVLKSIHNLYPEAPIYTSQYNEKGINWFKHADIRPSRLQILPSSLRRFLGPLRQHHFSHLDLSDYDLIISITGAEAKSIHQGTATHLCYCHVPTQYYWQFFDSYLKNPGFGPLDPLARLGLKLFIKPLRRADYAAAQRPDHFITISRYAATQIKRYYKRESTIIHPPVNTTLFHPPVENYTIKKGNSQAVKKGNKTIKNNKSQIQKTEHQISAHKIKITKSQPLINYSRQVTWKRLDLAVKACLNTKTPLLLIGDGPEHANLVKLAAGSPLITFLPALPQPELLAHLHSASAFLFPSLEPFGIAPVEALAAGVPVIAYAKGGSEDFLIEGKNGLTFPKQTVKSLSATIEKFQKTSFLPPAAIAQTVENFSESAFQSQLKSFISEHLPHDQ